jgi:hypothetical protein
MVESSRVRDFVGNEIFKVFSMLREMVLGHIMLVDEES